MQIGIIGAGQLGQMLGYAARELGHSCFYLDPSEHPPAAKVGPVIQAPFDDRVALTVLADKCDVLTYEFENVPVEALADIADLKPIYPPPEALRHAQDRLAEKQLFERRCGNTDTEFFGTVCSEKCFTHVRKQYLPRPPLPVQGNACTGGIFSLPEFRCEYY